MIAEQRSMAAALRAAGVEVTAVEVADHSHMGLVMDLAHPGDPALSALLKFIELHR
jgi:acetyl esterase/lipase